MISSLKTSMRFHKPISIVAVSFGFWLGACAHQNDGPLLVLEGDEEKICSELHAEHENADQLSEQNIDPRRRWLLQLMRKRDCLLPQKLDTKFYFYLTISG